MKSCSMLLFILFLQQGQFDATGNIQSGQSPDDCRSKNTEASSILHHLNDFFQGGSDEPFLTYLFLAKIKQSFGVFTWTRLHKTQKIANFFRREHITADDNKTMRCLEQIFMQFNNDFNLLRNNIESLKAEITMVNTLLEARRIMDNIFIVYNKLQLFKLHNEHDAKKDLVSHCERYDPSNSLIQLHLRVMTEPRLFDTILRGTEYSANEFEKLTNSWLKQSAMCAVLARECEFVKPGNASEALKNSRQQQIVRHLSDIRNALIQGRDSITSNFFNVTPGIIQREMAHVAQYRYDSTRAVNHIYNILEAKFPFRAWAVMLYARVAFNETDIHSHESSTNNWFFVNDNYHTVIVHSSDISLNCSMFMRNLRHKRLRNIFASDGSYLNFVTRIGHLGNEITTIRKLLIRQTEDLPQNYFISVLRYQPSLAIKREYNFHHFEHLRHPQTKKIEKSVLIGWC